MSRIERAIKATKQCTKALMKLSYNNFISLQKYDAINDKISDKNIINNNY